MRSQRRIEFFIFLATFCAFAWFNQGGGWNQNARFAEVRAIVEGGTLAIDSFLVYTRRNDSPIFSRPDIQNGDLVADGRSERLAWASDNGLLLPINGIAPEAEVTLVPLTAIACSGDVAFARGHFHPNKPPGTSLLAVPGYFLIHRIERLLGVNPDHWRVLATNAWLTSVLSVGVISALGCVIFFRAAKMLIPAEQTSLALAATWTFAFGTLFFPFATLLFDHDLTATFLLAAFYLIFSSGKNAPRRLGSLYLSGLAAGLAALTNYVAAVAVAILGIYLLALEWRGGLRAAAGALLAFAVGVLGPFLVTCAYHKACYGSPFVFSNDFQNPVFKDARPTFFGMFGVPDFSIALALLFSPFRGVFYSAPVLAMGVYGMFKIRKERPAEFWLISAMCALFFFINVTFFGWHAGFACGPRYLIPAIPFLALPMLRGFVRLPKLSAVLAALSIAINLLFSAVDAEAPAGIGVMLYLYDRPQWMQSPLTDYALPLFARGRAWPILNALIAEQSRKMDRYFAAAQMTLQEREAQRRELEKESRAAAERGEPEPFLAATIEGPVSANPVGVYEGNYYTLFPPDSPQARWNSFNVGELFFPQSRWSLAPLLALVALFIAAAHRALARDAQLLPRFLTTDGHEFTRIEKR